MDVDAALHRFNLVETIPAEFRSEREQAEAALVAEVRRLRQRVKDLERAYDERTGHQS